MPKLLILASGSRYRKALLARLQLNFICQAPELDETPLAGELPAAMAARLAHAKAHALAGQHRQALIIGSDQAAACDGQLLTKPGTTARAEAQLNLCQGKTVTFYTGLCLLDSNSGQFELDTIPYQVTFRALSRGQIAAYIRKEQPLDCAGSFKCEGLGSALFSQLQGQDPTALEGLPLIRLCEMLRQFGADPLDC
jgi:septum formation protein